MKISFYFFYKIIEQEDGSVPFWGVLLVEGGRMWEKGAGGGIQCKYCVHSM
jgi:hypothetical protein